MLNRTYELAWDVCHDWDDDAGMFAYIQLWHTGADLPFTGRQQLMVLVPSGKLT